MQFGAAQGYLRWHRDLGAAYAVGAAILAEPS
jgi:hypothetical protein